LGKGGNNMALLNPIDLAEPMVDISGIDPAVMGTYTRNGGKRSDKDIDSDDENRLGWNPQSGVDQHKVSDSSDRA